MDRDGIHVAGCRVNNLKNITVTIPYNKITVITGPSGSGKSSLAYDTIFADGHRRYLESLSPFDRSFLERMPVPDADLIEGIPPAICLRQTRTRGSRRSTLGTVTQIHSYLQVAFARCGTATCPRCHSRGKEREIDRKLWRCPTCRARFPEPFPSMFSFNSPHGFCPVCEGLGEHRDLDINLIIPDRSLSISRGALRLGNPGKGTWTYKTYARLLEEYGHDINTPICDLSPQALDALVFGNKRTGRAATKFPGIIPSHAKIYRDTKSAKTREQYDAFMSVHTCSGCKGTRYRVESLAVTLDGRNIVEVCEMNIRGLAEFVRNVRFRDSRKDVWKDIASLLLTRLDLLSRLGLDYLSLERRADTLSGGELQRSRLATQIAAKVVGAVYVLDEPTAGLHDRDVERLLAAMRELRDVGRGNTVVVVEHDLAVVRGADHVIDLGPGAGDLGGEVIFAGSARELARCKRSVTGRYLSGKATVSDSADTRVERSRKRVGTVTLRGATRNNLKNITVRFPLERVIAVTGVSGSGKSSLIETLCEALGDANSQKNGGASRKSKREEGSDYAELEGAELIQRLLVVDQAPIGRTPRSNPATYTKLFDQIRRIMARTPLAKKKGFKASHFSFNTPGGRCEECKGAGHVNVDMLFLPDVSIECATCRGRRYSEDVLEVTYRDHSISDILNLTVDEASELFSEEAAIHGKLALLKEVGLGYVRLGQSATTLSGGEAQRVKLSVELAKVSAERTLYVLDEPTTGLHLDDVCRLWSILRKLASSGNSVLLIEHNIEVIRAADYVIDLGPEGGDEKGGYLVAAGTPEEVKACNKSYTGRFI